MTEADQDLLLPAGTRLLHIGPPKTGTSSLQAAFHQNRPATLAQGVRYAGSSRHSGSAVLAVTGRPSFVRDQGSPAMRKWETLLRDVRNAKEQRVLVSSEFFADAESPAVKRAVEDLDRDRLHVVVTLRPLDRIITSQWQQYVQSSLKVGFGPWLEGTLKNPPGPTPTFWRRHRHDRLVERWAAEVGPERMTIVVIDDSDHDHILRVFERLLGLRSGTLGVDEELVNRSMTMPEIEAVRAFNNAFRDAGLGNALFHKVMHFGAAAYMKTRVPPPDEQRVRLPGWAREMVADVSQEMVANLKGSGVRVLGDLDVLVRAPPRDGALPDEDAAEPEEVCITPEIVAEMAVGMAVVAGHGRGTRPAAATDDAEERVELARYATYQLSGAVLGRMRRAAAHVIERALGRARGRGNAASPGAAGQAPPLTGVLLAAQEAIEARFDAEGIRGRAGRQLRERSRALAAQALANLNEMDAAGSGPVMRAGTCVPPQAAAWFALSVLEAGDVVRAVDPRAWPRTLRPVLWPWVEPPELARVPSRRIARTAPVRLLGGMVRRAWRRRMPG